jgi:hypothetical protein
MSGIGAINPFNIAYGVAMNLGTDVGKGTGAVKENNSGNPSNPSAIGGSNSGDLALSRVMFETVIKTNERQGRLPVLGSSEFARIAAAAVPGANVNLLA